MAERRRDTSAERPLISAGFVRPACEAAPVTNGLSSDGISGLRSAAAGASVKGGGGCPLDSGLSQAVWRAAAGASL